MRDANGSNEDVRLVSFDIQSIARAFIGFVRNDDIPSKPKNVQVPLFDSYTKLNNEAQKEFME